MSIKSTDGKLEMTLTAPEDNVWADVDTNRDPNLIKLSEIPCPRASLDLIFENKIDLTNIKEDSKIELYGMTKGD